MRDFLLSVYSDAGVLQHQNLGRIHSAGFEIEINGRPSAWLQATRSYAFQKSDDNDADRRGLLGLCNLVKEAD